MSTPPDPTISVDRFVWIQAFVSRIRELGAPAPDGDLFDLAGRLYVKVGGDPRSAAEAAWARWPTESGPLGA
jgi:hypothetical protein